MKDREVIQAIADLGGEATPVAIRRRCKSSPYRDNAQPTEGALRVWWIPQMPMTPFRFAVDSPAQAAFLMDALACYDIFQFENWVKPDYANAGGLEVFRNGEWEEWETDESDDIDAWARNSREDA